MYNLSLPLHTPDTILEATAPVKLPVLHVFYLTQLRKLALKILMDGVSVMFFFQPELKKLKHTIYAKQ
jgi:hypothetical protein